MNNDAKDDNYKCRYFCRATAGRPIINSKQAKATVPDLIIPAFLIGPSMMMMVMVMMMMMMITTNAVTFADP